jgi:hypothetical protein
VRPRGMAKRVPRIFILTLWPGAAWWPTETCPGEASGVLVGVRSPPLRGGPARHGWPCGERWEMTPMESSRRGALCAPAGYGQTCAQDLHFNAMAGRGLVAYGDMPGGSQGTPCGRAEPAPPGGTSTARMAVRGKVGDDAEGAFSEGRTLCARGVWPNVCPGSSF